MTMKCESIIRKLEARIAELEKHVQDLTEERNAMQQIIEEAYEK